MFVILGLVIIIAAAIFILMKNKSVIVPEQEITANIAPVNNFVEDCIDKELELLIREAGANGGYITELNYLSKGGYADYNSNYISFEPQRVAYWHHFKPCKESSVGCISSEQPPLCKEGTQSCPLQSFGERSIQEQIELALPGRLTECLNNFARLQSSFEITQLDVIKAEVIITDQEVFADVNMPIQINVIDDPEVIKLKDFTGEAKVDLTRAYEIADKIKTSELESQFLEQLTLHLLSVYAGVDSVIPPMKETTLMGEKHYWVTSNVKDLIEQEILPWTNFVQAIDAPDGYVPIMPPAKKLESMTQEQQLLYAGVFDYLTIRLNEQNSSVFYNNTKINFYYPFSESYLEINNGQQLLKPRSAETGGFLEKLTGIFMNDYRFRYDLAYPVIVNIEDTDAFDGRGFTFSLGLESNIYHNEPLKVTDDNNKVLLNTGLIDFAAPNNLVDNLIVVDVYDKHNNVPIQDASVSYRCGSDFYLGKTGTNGKLVTKAPYCRYGGAIIVSKEGFMGTGIEHDNYLEEKTYNYELELWPLKNKTLKVMKRNPQQVATLGLSQLTIDSSRRNRQELNDSDLVIFTIKRIPESYFDDEVPLIGFYTFNQKSQEIKEDVEAKKEQLMRLVDEGKMLMVDALAFIDSINQSSQGKIIEAKSFNYVDMVPGTYEVESFLIHNELVTIPEEIKEFCVVDTPLGCVSKKTVTFNATNFTSWMSGGLKLMDDEVITFNEQTIYNDQTMIFHILEQKIPETWSELEKMIPIEDYLADKRIMQVPDYG